MNILIIGSGGREHALAWKIAQSPRLKQLYSLPGNPGTAQFGINLPGDPLDLENTARLALKYKIDLAVIGPEVPLAAGLTDHLLASGIPVFGPSQDAARLESSKSFAKDFLNRHQLPTAEYQTFTKYEDAHQYILEYRKNHPGLPVIKASGLAAGKGVFLPETLTEAEDVLGQVMVEKRFGDAGSEVVIEERLFGREVSVLAFSDGKIAVPMPPVQDHKRLLDNDQGPNTGGMGVFAPSLDPRSKLIEQITTEIVQPSIDGLAAEGFPYLGVLYTGIILTDAGPKVLEYNCRFGDPETQVILPLLDSDLVDIMQFCVDGRLDEYKSSIRWKDAFAVCVILASGGYPRNYLNGLPIQGLDRLPEGIIAFQAGTKSQDGLTLTNGGRVLGVTNQAPSIDQARARVYEGIKQVHFEGMQYRQDIGATGTV